MTTNPKGRPPLVWVVDSTYTGERNARIGVAERLGYGYGIIPLPDADIQDYNRLLVDRYRRESNGNALPLLIINGTGEETTAQIADLRGFFEKQLFTVYLASILPDEPHPRLAEYNLVASPQLSGSNIVPIIGVPHDLTVSMLATSREKHAAFFNNLTKPIVGVLVGGNTRYCNGFDNDHAYQLSKKIAGIIKSLGGSLVITNSRRTPASAMSILMNQLNGFNPYLIDFQQENGLYHGLLAHASLFIVTGDSLSMCSEAAFTGKPILVDLSIAATENYHRKIIGKFIDNGVAKLLSDAYQPWHYQPLDPTGIIVDSINDHFLWI